MIHNNFLVVANDVTIKGGSFSGREAQMFISVCKYARKCHFPLVFWSANAGARIGSAQVLNQVLRVESANSASASYLYVRDQDYKDLGLQQALDAECLHVNDTDVRWKIRAILGFPGIGVENLSWSGAMAREMVLTRQEGLTLSYVSGRSVGIGAYLNKLGQRIIQKNDSPLLLTGAKALNQLYSKEVYRGNHELGGPGVMERNGISHIVVDTDQDGVEKIVHWIDGSCNNNTT